PLVPTLAEQLIAFQPARDYDCSSLARINIGGSHVTESLVDRLKARFQATERGRKRDDSGPAVVVHYGMTETGGGFASSARGGDGFVGPVGPGVNLRIVDARGQPVSSGQVGEILVRTPYAASGYWRDPERTAAVFRDGYVRTGDLGRVNDAGE